ncbi:MAG: AAA family ATPase [Desulfobacterales bacterium]
MKKQPLPVGISDFTKLISGGYYFVDKSDFIREVIETGTEVILFPRPRRFGKTLNLDMLRVFFEKDRPDTKTLFQGLSIEKEECFGQHQGKYPVISLTFKDIKELSWERCYAKISHMIRRLYNDYASFLSEYDLSEMDRELIRRMPEGKASQAEYEDGLRHLSQMLHICTGQPVVLLIDEYDTPLHAGYNKGYYEEIIGFMRNFLSGGLKDNPHLFKGVLTGILRVAKESIFSGLNNLTVYSVLTGEFSEFFGFTDAEVRRMLSDYDIADHHDEVKKWYDGYLFGGLTVYNPWSLISYVNSRDRKALPYWINTGDTSLMDRLATKGGQEIREEIGRLLEDRTVERPVYETIVMRDLDIRDDLLWSFLLFSGYLKPAGEPVYRNIYPLAIPNEEVKLAYEELVIRWFSEKIESNCLLDMIRGLETGDAVLFERLLRRVVMQIMSFHDLAGKSEKVYHALVLGMLVWMSGKYDIRSNRESGYGRFDIMLKPKDTKKTGIVIEFKVVDGTGAEDYKEVLEDAMKQIQDRQYAAELAASGIKDILEIAVAFRGKELWVKHRKSAGSNSL